MQILTFLTSLCMVFDTQMTLRPIDLLFLSCLYCNLAWSLFLGHLSHSGDLLLWVGVRRRASSVVRRPFTSSSQELLGQS